MATPNETGPIPGNGSQIKIGFGAWRLSIFGRDLIMVVLILAGFGLMLRDHESRARATADAWREELERDRVVVLMLTSIQRSNEATRAQLNLTNHLLNLQLPPSSRIRIPPPDWLDRYLYEEESKHKGGIR